MDDMDDFDRFQLIEINGVNFVVSIIGAWIDGKYVEKNNLPDNIKQALARSHADNFKAQFKITE